MKVSPLIKSAVSKAKNKIPLEIQSTWLLRGFSIYKLPLIAFVWPKVIMIDSFKSILEIPLTFRTKNHLNVMYFGALNIGAEVVIAMHVLDEINKSGKKIDFIFKSYKVDFLKRAEADVHFICDMGQEIRALIQQSAETPERCTGVFQSYAVTPSKTGDEKVAVFELTLSVKNKSFKKTTNVTS